MQVEVTQFLRPHGRREAMTTVVPDACRDGYANMLLEHCRLTAEVLTTGHISLCIEDTVYGDFDSRLVANGPDVPKALTDMLTTFRRSDHMQWVNDIQADADAPEVPEVTQ